MEFRSALRRVPSIGQASILGAASLVVGDPWRSRSDDSELGLYNSTRRDLDKNGERILLMSRIFLPQCIEYHESDSRVCDLS